MKKPLTFLLSACCLTTAVLFATPVRSNLGGAGIEDVPNPEYTINDYVQDGLVAMWDGVENAGWGIHNGEAVAPVNLISGTQAVVSSANPIVIGEDFFGTRYGRLSDTVPGICNAIESQSVCLEMIFLADRDVNGGIFSVGNRSVWLYAGTDYNVYALNYSTPSYTTSLNPQYKSDFPVKLTLNGGDGVTLTLDGISYIVPVGTGARNKDDIVYLGGLLTGGNLTNRAVDFFTVRIYNRPLTAQEIEYNDTIDKIRFGL